MKQELESFNHEQVLDLVRSGNSDAFHELYRRNRNRVTGFAYRFLHNKEEAKELTQEVFVSLWENRKKIDASKAPEVLLFVMVRSRFLDSLKRKARQLHYLENKIHEEPHLCSTDNYIDFKDCGNIVSKAIETLPKQAKIIYLLSRDNGWSHKEISEHMKLSKKTVNNQITKSTRHIRHYFMHFSPETALSAIFFLQAFLIDFI
ncbi:RNA polymerase sigma-70 factor [Mucilaginibacter sp. RB4R14]|uniref:RNA polymerase sigma-70 factor n=1 Tax=Mucilaginibacter aurantiaciroseus TaxID=2949308 RepID=UPI002090D432|nr:RNA polymerase sigma-70 factor [Mucilaginibacter aurantiaciroseus]MCO5937030.1 RNA polymerase sigma-70 factor [Mucilaginibacter aurantiaciroseus]